MPSYAFPTLQGDDVSFRFGVEAREEALICHLIPATATAAEGKRVCQVALQLHLFCQQRFITDHPGQREHYPLEEPP